MNFNARSKPELVTSGDAMGLERQVLERSVALTQANATLQIQLAEQRLVEISLRTANKDLEIKCQTQLEEIKRTLELEREQRALTEALRDTIATMSSTLDLNK